MALTQEQRVALIVARQYIAEGRDAHLCFALNRVARRYPKLNTAAEGLRAYIQRALSPYTTLEEWIARHELVKPPHLRRLPVAKADRREARIQWIDWMLDEPKEA
ncbi:hypothetical protein L0Y97_08010 [Burkholderia multivorans]|uniref:hypothetical protein n=1 Tax=Burkholderia multivorans TaxID=87883 RepID=UPI002019CAF2|nr:hypothetical protein [Burkholderia multivorans]MCO1358855.1 hypothetical protein [Burkholderia multivorans]MCO1418683.1 hypothetical protein [Burkholderia multivorans]UQO98100.1 hypothetical protein L0Z41_20810 [Burkholderia multivorans]